MYMDVFVFVFSCMYLGRFTSLLPLVFWCFGVLVFCFETKVNSVGREDMTCRRNKGGKGGREWREGRKRNSISQHQTIIL